MALQHILMFLDCDELHHQRSPGPFGVLLLEAHQPFAWGPRNCLGQNMAMHEMRLILAELVLLFDLKLCDESRGWLDQQTYALWVKNPLMCQVAPTGA